MRINLKKALAIIGIIPFLASCGTGQFSGGTTTESASIINRNNKGYLAYKVDSSFSSEIETVKINLFPAHLQDHSLRLTWNERDEDGKLIYIEKEEYSDLKFYLDYYNFDDKSEGYLTSIPEFLNQEYDILVREKSGRNHFSYPKMFSVDFPVEILNQDVGIINFGLIMTNSDNSKTAMMAFADMYYKKKKNIKIITIHEYLCLTDESYPGYKG